MSRLSFNVDLQPSLQVRLELARELYEECIQHMESRDFNLSADLRQRADLIMYGEVGTPWPFAIRLTAFALWKFLEESQPAS